MFYLICVCALLIGYFVGSIPTGYWIVKHKTGMDIREMGSGSTGATNVSRVLGKKWFFIVMFLDMLKGFLPVLAVQLLADGNVFYVVCIAIGLVLGHCFSCFLKFKGGKSVATGWGVFFCHGLGVGHNCVPCMGDVCPNILIRLKVLDICFSGGTVSVVASSCASAICVVFALCDVLYHFYAS